MSAKAIYLGCFCIFSINITICKQEYLPKVSVVTATLDFVFTNDLLASTRNSLNFLLFCPKGITSTNWCTFKLLGSMNDDLSHIIEWGNKNLAVFNSSKTQKCFE